MRRLLEADDDLAVVGEAASAADALAVISPAPAGYSGTRRAAPAGDGIDVWREIRSRRPELTGLMLTSFAEDETLSQAILAGAAGYVLKQIRGNELVASVPAVASGHCPIDGANTSRVLDELRRVHAESEMP
ncbi:MAG: response regulator transcription factor [Acidimicrobiales bacterium]|nr:response regulator transcription factor [Acidimicrobiales bacterium]